MSKQHKRSFRSPSSLAQGSVQAASAPDIPLQTRTPIPDVSDDHEVWKAHWIAQGQPWRTEPEIDEKRQEELQARRMIELDIKRGIYPFRNMKLSRADIEWLLSSHENGRGPVEWDDESQRGRRGLDLRGALLMGIDVSGLPLACIIGGMPRDYWFSTTPEEKEMAAIHLEGARSSRVHMEAAELGGAHLERVNCYKGCFEKAFFREAHLERTYFRSGYLNYANFRLAHLEGTNFRSARLEGATLKEAFMDSATILNDIAIGSENDDGIVMADVRWNNANLAVIDWSLLKISGDEYRAKNPLTYDGIGEPSLLLKRDLFLLAVRAYRQLAVALRNQGVNEQADRFTYRALILQKNVFSLEIRRRDIRLRQRLQLLGALFLSWLLFLIAGYGYKPSRSFLAYFLVITGFATAYYFLGHAVGPSLSPLGAFVFSMTSFHGRGFFPGNNISLDDPLTVLAALEALVGLIIEVTFIATLTQRFFNR